LPITTATQAGHWSFSLHCCSTRADAASERCRRPCGRLAESKYCRPGGG